ncbi:MAG: HEAT repeat domain-containing protein, partial [Gemmatimonadetes bacterium]|nr:HEAT repeat domain-containing protein [Gemmatimonadota bacterium]
FVGTAGDRQLLGTLLADPHPAVAVAAVSALPGVADDGLVAQVVDAYPSLSPFVRGFLDLTLRELREPVTRALVSRMRMDAPTLALARRIALAEALDLLPVLDQAMALRGHVDADVRAAVARAARRLPRDATVQLLARMTRDADVTVRVEAARSLGELGPGSVPFLGGALHDTSWRVRRQAALSLALLGERGRLALREARADADPYVRDIASLVSGLSDGALLEITAR